ncbi:MAG: GGDEF domain-containing protein [Planctomycetes bacterium]|nr:GGDEF domain-containing protein [Planctomycetota bacterium]
MVKSPAEQDEPRSGRVLAWLSGRLRSARAWDQIRARLPERLPLPRQLLVARLAVVCTIIVFGIACVAVVWQLGPLRRELQTKAGDQTILIDLRARIAAAAFLDDATVLDDERARVLDQVGRLSESRREHSFNHDTVGAAIGALESRRQEEGGRERPAVLLAEIDQLIKSLRQEELETADLLDTQFDLLTLLVVGALVLSTATLLLMERTNRAKEKLAALHYRATHDHLSQGLNRGAIFQVAERELARAMRREHSLAVILVDLDQFKEINDGWGHAAGDAVIRECALRLRRNVRIYDSVGRYGGDEFLLVLPAADEAEADRIAARLAGAFREPFDLGDHLHPVTISLGGAVHHGGEESLDDLIARADRALYRTKQAGRDGWTIDRQPPIPRAPAPETHPDESEIGPREQTREEGV